MRVLLVLAVLCASCARFPFAMNAAPPAAALAPRPCGTAPPKRALLEMLSKPEVAEMTDAEGAGVSAVRSLATTESWLGFFNYVKALEELAARAHANCVER